MASQHHEIELWREIRSGSEKALHQLYMLHYDRLFRYGLHLGRDRAAAMDGINETFIDVWTHREHLPEVSHVSGYLFIIFKRKLSRPAAKYDTVYAVTEVPFAVLDAPQPSYEDLLIAYQTQQQQQDRLKRALDKLTSRQKALISLRYFEGLSIAEISRQEHIAARTIYNTLHTAIGILRMELHPDG